MLRRFSKEEMKVSIYSRITLDRFCLREKKMLERCRIIILRMDREWRMTRRMLIVENNNPIVDTTQNVKDESD